MNRDEAKALLPIIQAWADGKTIQVRRADGGWINVHNDPQFTQGPKNYRIKPTTLQYRVALFKGEAGAWTNTYHGLTEWGNTEKDDCFVRWLGDVQEVEV